MDALKSFCHTPNPDPQTAPTAPADEAVTTPPPEPVNAHQQAQALVTQVRVLSAWLEPPTWATPQAEVPYSAAEVLPFLRQIHLALRELQAQAQRLVQMLEPAAATPQRSPDPERDAH
jgi:hypothetical protein